MERFVINPVNPQRRFIQRAVDVLANGGLIIYPTDTVYGLGCDLHNKKAIQKIYQIKGYKKKKRLSFICPDLKNIAKYAHVDTPAYKVMRYLTPGPYTFLLEATREVPKIMVEKRKTVGIRVPDNNVCHALLEAFGNPIISTSARFADEQYTNKTDELEAKFSQHVDLFLESDGCGLEPSTIIDFTNEEPKVVRQGKGYSNDLL